MRMMNMMTMMMICSSCDNLCAESAISLNTHAHNTRLTRDNLLHAGTYLHPGHGGRAKASRQNKLVPLPARNSVSGDEEA
jgi:hypothetical protein